MAAFTSYGGGKFAAQLPIFVAPECELGLGDFTSLSAC